MPFVRGQVIPETELGGRAKRNLDVLLWINAPKREDLATLDELDTLRVYLRSMDLPEQTGEFNMAIPRFLYPGEKSSATFPRSASILNFAMWSRHLSCLHM